MSDDPRPFATVAAMQDAAEAERRDRCTLCGKPSEAHALLDSTWDGHQLVAPITRYVQDRPCVQCGLPYCQQPIAHGRAVPLPRAQDLPCKTCSIARIFIPGDGSVFIVHGQDFYHYAAGSAEAAEHIRKMQVAALGGVLQMALAKKKAD